MQPCNQHADDIFLTRRLAYPTQFGEAKLHFSSKIHPPSPSCGRNLALYFTGRMSEEPNKVKPLSSRSTRGTRRGLETFFCGRELQHGKWRCFFVFGVMGDAKLIKEALFFEIKDIIQFIVSLNTYTIMHVTYDVYLPTWMVDSYSSAEYIYISIPVRWMLCFFCKFQCGRLQGFGLQTSQIRS